MNIVEKISYVLPKIRGCGAEEKELVKLISSVHVSPFNIKETENYLDRLIRNLHST